jgi:hypothetical protein
MNILVTGGLGVVGRPLVQRLLNHGHTVRVLDRREQCMDGAQCVVADVTDFAAVREQVCDMDAIVHLAALTHPAAGPGHDIFRINATGTFNVYEAAAQQGIRRVVCASSINALGFNFGVKSFPIQYLPMDEAHPICTSDAYSFSKQITEEIGAYYWRREGISGVQLRLPLVYPMLDEFNEMVKQFINRARHALAEFAALPEAEQRAQAERVIAAREQERALRMSEKPWDAREREQEGGADGFEQLDPLMLLLSQYADFWAAISGADAAQAFEQGVTATYEGSHPLYVCEDQNSLSFPSATLAGLFYPDATLKRPLAGAKNLVSFERASQLIGFAPEHHMSDWLNTKDA